jgi:hypothetical protein
MAFRNLPATRAIEVVLAALTVLALGTACTTPSGGGGPTSSGVTSKAATASSPSTSLDAKQASAAESAVTAYLGYVREYAAASQIPDPDYPGLARYVNQPLLSRTRHALRSLKDSGEVQLGAQTATVRSTSVDLTGAQPSATIHACLDYSALKLVHKADQSPVPNSQIKTPRVAAIVTVWLFSNGQWMVTDTKDGTDPC